MAKAEIRPYRDEESHQLTYRHILSLFSAKGYLGGQAIEMRTRHSARVMLIANIWRVTAEPPYALHMIFAGDATSTVDSPNFETFLG